jgi:hypothetical protein
MANKPKKPTLGKKPKASASISAQENFLKRTKEKSAKYKKDLASWESDKKKKESLRQKVKDAKL